MKAPMSVTKALLNAQRELDDDSNFAGQVEILNPLMDDHQTGLDTLHLVLGAGYSEWHKDRLYERNTQKGNPDYLMPDIGYYFTGDVNATGTKVKETNDGKTGRGSVDGYIDNEGSTFYRWGNSAPSHHLNKLNELDHLIGLHSHSHPSLLEALPYNEQKKEYENNKTILSEVLNIDKNNIKYMSHPNGSYNDDTLKILQELKIELGFKQIMTIEPEKKMKKINNSSLEIARQDHARIIKMMN